MGLIPDSENPCDMGEEPDTYSQIPIPRYLFMVYATGIKLQKV